MKFYCVEFYRISICSTSQLGKGIEGSWIPRGGSFCPQTSVNGRTRDDSGMLELFRKF